MSATGARGDCEGGACARKRIMSCEAWCWKATLTPTFFGPLMHDGWRAGYAAYHVGDSAEADSEDPSGLIRRNGIGLSLRHGGLLDFCRVIVSHTGSWEVCAYPSTV